MITLLILYLFFNSSMSPKVNNSSLKGLYSFKIKPSFNTYPTMVFPIIKQSAFRKSLLSGNGLTSQGSEIYNINFFHFLIFVLNVPKGATVLT